MKYFIHLEPDGEETHGTEKWVESILSISLSNKVPTDLCEIFERSQAAIVYGCYHYPLFTLGFEELLRYYESLLKFKLGVDGKNEKGKPLSFADLIKRAVENKLITDTDQLSWDAARKLRNLTTHKNKTILIDPSIALRALEDARRNTEFLISSIS